MTAALALWLPWCWAVGTLALMVAVAARDTTPTWLLWGCALVACLCAAVLADLAGAR